MNLNNIIRQQEKPFEDWHNILIKENNEKLVSITKYNNPRIIAKPKYFLDGHKGAINDIYVREQVYSKLEKSLKLLPKKYNYIIWDGWRPVEVQESLFNMVFKDFRAMGDKWINYSDKELKKYIAENCCSLPSINPLCPPPHNTGGAIDLSLIDNDGQLLEMGTEFDEFKEDTITRYYEVKLEKNQQLTLRENIILNNRRLLYNVLIEVGFINFSEEWWHYDLGNQFWASKKNTTAIYGATKLK